MSCQKCNVLKSSDWHGCENEINGHTFIGKLGYLDRFAHNYFDYLNIDENGYLLSLNDSSPVDYMIQRLHLNRPNRVFIRQKRLLKIKAKELLDKIKTIGDDILFQYDTGQLQAEVALSKIRNMQRLQHMIMEFYDITP
ncbi:hypothetical protein LNO81_31290 [Klebsiella variicola subsp. variicola]|nr:hypothetical protein [Klebsiella variicola subsp. variicola]